MTTNGNDAAFAEVKTRAKNGSQYLGKESYYGETYSTGGLTKREMFAAMAMQGMLASNRDERDSTFDWLAEDAVNAADTLIKALNAPQPTDTDA